MRPMLALAQRFQVTGVDISAWHVALAQRNVPNATFVQADMTKLTFPPASFDAVAAFYSIIHVPREGHPDLLRSIATGLKPGGLFVAAIFSCRPRRQKGLCNSPVCSTGRA